MYVTFLLKYWKLLLGAALLAGFISTIGYMKYQNADLSSTNAELVEVNRKLETDISVAQSINQNNASMIESLKADAKAKDEILAKYRADVAAESKKVQGLINYIGRISPTENGPVAPVLAVTVSEIQRMQDERAAARENKK